MPFAADALNKKAVHFTYNFCENTMLIVRRTIYQPHTYRLLNANNQCDRLNVQALCSLRFNYNEHTTLVL